MEKTWKASTCWFRVFYFLTTNPVCYYLIKDEPWLPPMMGGKGELELWDDGLPTWRKPAYFDVLYCAMLGTYMEDIFELFYQEYLMGNKQ